MCPDGENTSAAMTGHGKDVDLVAMSCVLVVDPDRVLRERLARGLGKRCAVVKAAGSLEEADQLVQRQHFDLMLVSIEGSAGAGLAWAAAQRSAATRCAIVFMTENPDLDTALRVLRVGAADLIPRPVRLEGLLKCVDHCLRRDAVIQGNALMREQLAGARIEAPMIGNSPAMRECRRLIECVAPSRSVVLIEGETGAGKELVARSIHELSDRQGPFVPLNCVAIPPELFESELFGHARGAFTGASADREGLFQHAGRGTLFLDEISEMPMAMQAKLLRVLEEHCVRPVGADRETPVDARVVAATNRNLREAVAAGRFRQDLFYRLEAVTLRVPALRERRGDVLALAGQFLSEFARQSRGTPPSLSRGEADWLLAHDWPGNVRELRNMMERYVLFGSLPDNLHQRAAGGSPRERPFPVDWPLEDVERAHILAVLEAAKGNKSEAARRLGIARRTLERKLARWRQPVSRGQRLVS